MTEHTQLNPHDSPSLTHLAQAAMPADTQQLIDNVDSIVESAKRVIDLSLKQSGTLIEQSQQQLDTLPKSTASAITAQPKTEQQQAIKDQRALEKQQFEYQKNMLEQQEKTVKWRNWHSKKWHKLASKWGNNY
ncbi:hypothetical protein [Shewanella woodyi]|uniref:hypothetical protein n=1 Tax=Shewanella woodyi TaxID=60961 RepID=UPI003747D9F8